jgi:hypothetical protein
LRIYKKDLKIIFIYHNAKKLSTGHKLVIFISPPSSSAGDETPSLMGSMETHFFKNRNIARIINYMLKEKKGLIKRFI